MIPDLAKFADQRQTMLTQRLRAARTSGSMPIWRTTDSDAKSARAAVVVASPPSAAPDLPPATSAGTPTSDALSQCAMVVGAIAAVVLVAYVVKMVVHQSTRRYDLRS